MTINLPPESESGCVEYKLYIAGQRDRLEGLKTQLNSRLFAGRGRATYWIGVRDDGVKVGLLPAMLQASLTRFYTLVQETGARVDSETLEKVTGNPFYANAHLRRLLHADVVGDRWVACVVVCRDLLVFPPLYLDEENPSDS